MEQYQENSVQPQQDQNTTHWWIFWLLVGLGVIFIVILFILRSLCSDVWYIRLLGLNNGWCNQSSISGNQPSQKASLSLNGDELSISGGNSVKLPLTVNTQPGPAGATGTKGATGSVGSTGAIGPAGPTDPCVIAGTYFCQNGNSYGATAQLGTLDNQDLQVATSGSSSLKIDTLGNIIPNRYAVVGGLVQPAISGTSYSNIIIPTNVFAPGVTSVTDSSANILLAEASTLNNSSYNIGWVQNSSLTGTGLNIIYTLGSTIDSGYGLVGQFIGTNITNSNNLVGHFGSYGGSSTISNSSDVIGSVDAGSTVDHAQDVILGLQGNASVTTASNSLIRLNSGSGVTIDSSIIQDTNGVISNVSRVIANGNEMDLSSVSDSAVIGSTIGLSDSTRSAITGVAVTAQGMTNTNVTGFSLTLNNVDWSNVNGFNATVTDASWNNILINGPVSGSTSIQNISHFTGLFLGENTIDGIYGGIANINDSIVNTSGGLYGAITYANVDSTDNIDGIFGGYCNNTDPLSPFRCDAGYNIQFDIDNSNGLIGTAKWTNIYSSG